MPTFKYEGHLANGKAITGSIEASNEEDAGQILRSSGVFVRKVAEGDVTLVYDHSPKPRDGVKVYDPDEFVDVPQPKPAPKINDQLKSTVDNHLDVQREGLIKKFVHLEEFKRELKSVAEKAISKKKMSAKQRKALLAKVHDQIDQACIVALGTAMRDLL